MTYRKKIQGFGVQSYLLVSCLSESTSQFLLLLDNSLRKTRTNPSQYEERPLPPERIDDDDEYEPVDQFGISEKLKGTRRCETFDPASEVDPSLHKSFVRSRERIDEEHDQESSVYADMIIAHCADGIDICAVIRANIHVLGREDL